MASASQAGRVYDHATVCCCVPLRSAVALTGTGCVVLALAQIAAPAAMQEGLRLFVGGYAAPSRTLIGLLGILGLFAGLVGIAGAVQLKASFVKLYLDYQVVRLLAWLAMYYADAPLLWNCELWTKDLKQAVHQHGWNDIMFNVAMNNHCSEERTLFIMYSIPALLFFLHCTMATYKLLAELEEEPKYLLKAPKGAPSGAFYSRSLASRSIREQLREEEEAAAAERQRAPEAAAAEEEGATAPPPAAPAPLGGDVGGLPASLGSASAAMPPPAPYGGLPPGGNLGGIPASLGPLAAMPPPPPPYASLPPGSGAFGPLGFFSLQPSPPWAPPPPSGPMPGVFHPAAADLSFSGMYQGLFALPGGPPPGSAPPPRLIHEVL